MMVNLSGVEQARLLEIARRSVTAHVTREDVIPEEVHGMGLQQQCGCFVTLKRQGQLRGCLGNFISPLPLVRQVIELAGASALHDPRFPPMAPGELVHLTIEISVLSPLTRVTSLKDLEVGRDGLYVIRGQRRGVLLPQVASEHGWDMETFLSQTCRKAGLPPEAWHDPTTEIYSFTAQVFGDDEAHA